MKGLVSKPEIRFHSVSHGRAVSHGMGEFEEARLESRLVSSC